MGLSRRHPGIEKKRADHRDRQETPSIYREDFKYVPQAFHGEPVVFFNGARQARRPASKPPCSKSDTSGGAEISSAPFLIKKYADDRRPVLRPAPSKQHAEQLHARASHERSR
jgi:hypothetical protein